MKLEYVESGASPYYVLRGLPKELDELGDLLKAKSKAQGSCFISYETSPVFMKIECYREGDIYDE